MEVYTCKAPAKQKVKQKKGKKNVKKISKKAKPAIIKQNEEEPTENKCNPEYIYLSGFYGNGFGSRLQLPSLPTQGVDSQKFERIERNDYASPFNPALTFNAPQPYGIINTRYVFTPAPVQQTPLPASFWLFVSGLAVIFKRKFK
jgi:hypothetical protein